MNRDDVWRRGEPGRDGQKEKGGGGGEEEREGRRKEEEKFKVLCAHSASCD